MKMGVGSRAKITSSAEYAYGKEGFKDWGIEPDSVLIFDIEVLEIKKAK